jgi:hypothetical protein
MKNPLCCPANFKAAIVTAFDLNRIDFRAYRRQMLSGQEVQLSLQGSPPRWPEYERYSFNLFLQSISATLTSNVSPTPLMHAGSLPIGRDRYS